MADYLTILLEKSTEALEADNLDAVVHAQTLKTCGRRLKEIAHLEETLGLISIDLKVTCRDVTTSMQTIKPLREKTRIATSLIRNHIALNEMREAAEEAAWTELGQKQHSSIPGSSRRTSGPHAAQELLEKNKSALQKVPETENENKSVTLDEVADDLTKAQTLLTPAKTVATKNLMGNVAKV